MFCINGVDFLTSILSFTQRKLLKISSDSWHFLASMVSLFNEESQRFLREYYFLSFELKMYYFHPVSFIVTYLSY